MNVNGCKEFDNIRVIRMDVSEAAGPVYARARQAGKFLLARYMRRLIRLY